MAMKINDLQPARFLVALARIVLRDLVLWKTLQADHNLKTYQDHHTLLANHCGEEFALPGVDYALLESLHRKHAQYLTLKRYYGAEPEEAILAVFRFLVGNVSPIDWVSRMPRDIEQQQAGYRIHAVDEAPMINQLVEMMQEAANDPHRGTLDAIGVYTPAWIEGALKRPTDRQYFMGMVKATTWVGMFDRDLYEELAGASPLFIPGAEDGLADAPPMNADIDNLLRRIKQEGIDPEEDAK